MYSTDTNAALAAMGAKTKVPDGRVVGDALIAYLNKTGGIAGHPVAPSYYNVHASDSPAAISQGACTQWTQDDHVFAALPAASVQDNALLRNCLGRAGVLALYPNFYTETLEQDFARAPLWFEPEPVSLETWARVYAAGLAAQGFLKGTKIGLVYDDGPAFTGVVKRVLLPELKRLGGNVVAQASESIHGAGDLGSGGNQMSNTVLAFRTAGVTNVMFFEVWQGWFLFLQNAKSQRWYPTYGLSSQNAVQIDIETGLIPTDQLVGARLVGWNPGVDVRPADSGSWIRKKLCLQIYAKAGMSPDPSDTEGYHGLLALCQGMLLLQDAGRVAASPLTPKTLAQGLGSMQAPPMANLPTGHFNAHRHYGADSWRPGAYRAECTCFSYTGNPVRM
jgi:hypothetical protein